VTTLNLGVVDVPYEDEGAKPKGNAKRGQGSSKSEPSTTAQVAQILEEKYGVMEAFSTAHKDDITQALINSLEGAMETILMGGPVPDPFAEAGQAIQAEFRTFLMTAEVESMGIEGVPTQASINRRSLRFKSKVADKPRPSFIDTGTYELSMRAWVET
jgi:hypothetical protein